MSDTWRSDLMNAELFINSFLRPPMRFSNKKPSFAKVHRLNVMRSSGLGTVWWSLFLLDSFSPPSFWETLLLELLLRSWSATFWFSLAMSFSLFNELPKSWCINFWFLLSINCSLLLEEFLKFCFVNFWFLLDIVLITSFLLKFPNFVVDWLRNLVFVIVISTSWVMISTSKILLR